MCEGREPGTYAACEVAKAASCKLWKEIQHAVEGEVRAVLEPNFNQRTYEDAEKEGRQKEYMAKCEAAGIAICAALGAKYGGVWGAALSGAAGTFISWRLCEQSMRW